jgi:hypothetical protein
MIFNDTDLELFIEAYESDTGERVSMEEAGDAARRLFALIELLASEPCPNKDIRVP